MWSIIMLFRGYLEETTKFGKFIESASHTKPLFLLKEKLSYIFRRTRYLLFVMVMSGDQKASTSLIGVAFIQAPPFCIWISAIILCLSSTRLFTTVWLLGVPTFKLSLGLISFWKSSLLLLLDPCISALPVRLHHHPLWLLALFLSLC